MNITERIISLLFLGIFGFGFVALADDLITESEQKFPDTLDLMDRAELAINPLTSFADPHYDYAVWWRVDARTRECVDIIYFYLNNLLEERVVPACRP